MLSHCRLCVVCCKGIIVTLVLFIPLPVSIARLTLLLACWLYCIHYSGLHHLIQAGEVLLHTPVQRLHLALDILDKLLVLFQQVGHLLILGSLEPLQEFPVLVVERGHALLGVLDSGKPLSVLHLLLHQPQLLKQLLVGNPAEVLDPLVQVIQLVPRRNQVV